MSQQELLSKLVDVLDQARIPYMLTGSIASSLHGEPRSTHDVDVVVVLDPESITKLLGAFSEKQIHDALRIYEVQHGRWIKHIFRNGPKDSPWKNLSDGSSEKQGMRNS
jgi:hypothetical protein